MLYEYEVRVARRDATSVPEVHSTIMTWTHTATVLLLCGVELALAGGDNRLHGTLQKGFSDNRLQKDLLKHFHRTAKDERFGTHFNTWARILIWLPSERQRL